MAKLAPFKALRYDKIKVKDLGKALAPPYDIINAREQDELYARHPNNVVRLDFGKTQAADDERVNKYSRAATLLRLWREQGVLKTDPKPGLYVVAHDYTGPDNKKRTWTGVYSLLKVEDYKTRVVRPHEKTLSKPKADRLDLTTATKTNFSPIFFLFDDPKNKAQKWLQARMKGKPQVETKTPNGDRHRLWIVEAASAQKPFLSQLAKQPIYIADGHHRYETMLKYSAMKHAPKLKKEAAWTMACLTPFQSQGLMILPTHRLLHSLRGFSAEQLRQDLAQDFEVKSFPDINSLTKAMELAAKPKPVKARGKKKAKPQPGIAFGLLSRGASQYHLLTLRDSVDPIKVIKDKRADATKRLDVTVLQSLVLEKLLKMTPESIASQDNLFYDKSASSTAMRVSHGEVQAAFLLNATRMEQLKEVSDAKDVMPQKSTYFQPKLITGLILRAME